MNKQQGNVLFLILIAVALFAALSYAVTTSSRGSGNADSEKVKISTAQWLSYVASTRTAIQRMIFSATDLQFCVGGLDFCGIGEGFDDLCSTGTTCLFAPEGGGAVKPLLPSGKTAYFIRPGNSISIDGIGTPAADAFIQYTDELSANECQEINRGLGISTTLLEETDSDLTFAEDLPLSGQWDFCYDALSSVTTYYMGIHVLYEQ